MVPSSMCGLMSRCITCGSYWVAYVSGWVLVTAIHLHASPCFISGIIPNDTQNIPVHAHGGFLLRENGSFYWFGTSQKIGPDWLSSRVHLYRSRDLSQWEFVGPALSSEDIAAVTTDIPPPYRIERPKVIFNRLTGHYVMWFHLDLPDFSMTSVGVAKAPSITSPFMFLGYFLPDGEASYDMTLFVDEEEEEEEVGNTTRPGPPAAYLIRSVGNQYTGISRLTEDYLNTTGICSTAPQMEAHAVFKDRGRYYLLGSHLTGWDPNPPLLFYTDGPLCHPPSTRNAPVAWKGWQRSSARLHGVLEPSKQARWKARTSAKFMAPLVAPRHSGLLNQWGSSSWAPLPCPATGEGADTCFNSQATFVYRLRASDLGLKGKSSLLIYFGDRWNHQGPGSVGNASYVWLPLLRAAGSGLVLEYRERWCVEDYLTVSQT